MMANVTGGSGIGDTASEASSAARLVVVLIVVGTALRLVLAGATGLGMDESYSVGSARQLLMSYVDHPPLHYWAAGLAMRLFHSEWSLVVRLPAILFFAGSTWLMYRLTARLFGARAGLWAATALNIAPVFTLAHASWVLPDGPLMFFMLATANVVAAIVFAEPQVRRPLLWWLAAGILGGLAMLSKYTGVFVFVGVLAYVLTVPQARRHLLSPGPWLAVVVALVIFSPVLVWNAQHGDVGMSFQTRRLPGGSDVHPMWLLEFLGGQALYLFPLLFVPFAMALLRALSTGRREPHGWLIALIAAGPILLFNVVSLFAHSQPHWPMPGWVFTIVLFGRDAAILAAQRPRFARRYMAWSGGIVAALLAALIWQTLRGGLIPASADPRVDVTLDLLDWRELKPELTTRGLLGSDAVVASPIWMTAGKVSYALGPDIPVVCVCGDPQQFRYRYDQRQWSGRDMPVIVPEGAGNQRLWADAAHFFDRLDPLPPITIGRAGRSALVLDVRMGRNLHFPPL
jgi:4-amino-4-deoxy-L-arabinose transferase-like glycosyltransferase